MEDVKIRFARPEDISQIIGLCHEHADYERAEIEENVNLSALSDHIFQSSATIKCLVVEHKKEIVGYATFMKQFSTWHVDFYIYLDCLYLKEKVRGKGIGKRIMEKIKSYAENQNCRQMQWQTPEFNESAILFYKKTGAEGKLKVRFHYEIT